MKSLFIIPFFIALSACGPSPAPQKIAEPQREALEKARQVEGVVLKQAAEQASAAENN
ncbi:hypothetical protein HA050_03815 [Iodobacter sp. HSC-16F04]|uniref:Lipoprotein n=1 Tax=Iodobacter violaceini TaxID=3044271 RepID=A0ABX0KNH2_9NEIS|nr:hypothetical protein [Iodobacter violacea]NHQ85236.1 hypothetical protein [Iodobacter violacea]